MICPNCGLECEDSQDTCSLCGYSFAEKDSPAPAEIPQPEPAAPQHAVADTVAAAPKKKNTTVIVLTIIIVILVLAGAAMAVLLLLRPNDSGNSQTAVNMQTTIATAVTTETTTTEETTVTTTTTAATTTAVTTTTVEATEAAAEAETPVLSGNSFRVEKGTAFPGEVFCMDVTLLGQDKNYVENVLGTSLTLEDWQWWGTDLKAAFVTYNNLDIALFFQNNVFVMAYYDCYSSVQEDIAAAQDFVFSDYPASSNGIYFGETGYLEIYEEVYAETGENVTRQRYVSYDMY